MLKRSGEITITGRTHVGGIRGVEADVSHDGDHHMLLHVEPSGVKTPSISEGGKLVSRKDLLQEFTCWESATHDQLSVVVRRMLGPTERTVAGRRLRQRRYQGCEC